jgi:dTMP kinase
MLISIEGTDCSGKETQSNLLYEKLKNNYQVYKTSFPMYESATGKIVGGSYLGKKSIGECLFKEGAVNVDPKIASLYYAADRLYNIDKIYEHLNKNEIVILDRYVESNMAHQGGKIFDSKKRNELYDWLNELEYGLMKLPHPDITIFLYMPYEYALKLKKNRTELDQHELSKEHLLNAEKAYLELAHKFNFVTINCVANNEIRSIEDINKEIYDIISNYFMKKAN